jgi:integrase
MDTDENVKKELKEESQRALDPEEAKRLAMRKRKPLGPVVKPLTEEEIDAFLHDPEIAERDHLLDAMPRGAQEDDHDAW